MQKIKYLTIGTGMCEEDSLEPSTVLERDQLRSILGKLTYRRHSIKDFTIIFNIIYRLLRLVERGVQIPRETLDEELRRREINL